MPRRRLTRRQALELGAAAAAVRLVRPSTAAACAAAFEMPVDLRDQDAVAASAAGWRTSRVTAAPRRFDLIGLRWRRGVPVEAQVRARRRGGSWTPWVTLHLAGDHAPDAGRAPAGSEPAFVGSADLFQLRVRGSARDLKARFVRALPDARRARRRAVAAGRRQTPAGAPPIILRPQWGGDGCPPRSEPSFGEVHMAFVHHTVTANEYAAEEAAGIVLGICRYHRDHNKWNDLGYNFLVDKYGQVFEGRAGGIEQAVIGAQAQGYNRWSTGIACLGDFGAVAQSEAGLDSLAKLLAWKLGLHGAPVTGQVTVESGGGDSNRYASGTPVTFERISGHRDGNETSCPGQALYDQLAVLRARAAGQAGPVSVLTLKLAASSVPLGKRVQVSGTLRFSDGASPAGAAVEVEHSPDGTRWASLARARTGASGRWDAAVSAPRSGRLRARFAGDSAHPPLESSAAALTVLPRLMLTLEPRPVQAANAISVRGTYAPSPWPSKAELLFERQVGRRWVKVSSKQINIRGGKFATRVRPPRPGLYRVSVTVPGAITRRLVRATTLTGGASGVPL